MNMIIVFVDCHTRLNLGLSIASQRHDDRYEPAMKQPIIRNHNFFHESSRKKKTSSVPPRLDLSFKLFPNDETALNDRELVTRSSSSSIDTDDEQDKSGGRKVMMDGRKKKLRLSMEQTSLLDNTFKLQTTLNTVFIP
ncbi:unnamed protein product [Linum trigynum]|uniref:Uncharacterized protein n=1 Tax=Linum trigynum TaxID=586398 RepID=A0AAV2GT91_9ROSI